MSYYTHTRISSTADDDVPKNNNYLGGLLTRPHRAGGPAEAAYDVKKTTITVDATTNISYSQNNTNMQSCESYLSFIRAYHT